MKKHKPVTLMQLKTNLLPIFSLILVLACGSPAVHEGTATENLIENEVPKRELRQVTFSGSGYELGLQHGQYFKKEIGEIVLKWKESTASQLKRDPEEVLEEFFAYADFEGSIKKWTPDLYEEVRGIAEGSGQRFEQIMVLNLLDEFWVYLNSIENHHCSNIGVPSVNGGLSYIAQNMDIESYTDGFQTLFRIEATVNRPEQLVLSHPGLIALNGMNSSGVGLIMNTIMQLNASNSGLPVAFVVRKVLASTDKDEIIKFITSVNHASGQNYIMGVRGEVFNFEASANKVVRFDPGNKNQTVYHTNHPIVNDDVKPWFAEFNPKEIAETVPVTSNSYIRLAALKTRIADTDAVTDDLIKEALRSKDDANNPVCRTLDPKKNGFTFASVVMTLTGEPYLQITAGPPSESEYLKVVFSSSNSDKQEINLEANRDIVKNYHRVWSDGQLTELDNILAPDFVCHFINGIEWQGVEGAKNSISSHRKSFPDWKEEIVDMVSEGDKVVTRYKSTGTHQGTFEGLDPTGKKVTIYEISIYRIENGKIAEQWGFPDALSLNNQLSAKK